MIVKDGLGLSWRIGAASWRATTSPHNDTHSLSHQILHTLQGGQVRFLTTQLGWSEAPQVHGSRDLNRTRGRRTTHTHPVSRVGVQGAGICCCSPGSGRPIRNTFRGCWTASTARVNRSVTKRSSSQSLPVLQSMRRACE